MHIMRHLSESILASVRSDESFSMKSGTAHSEKASEQARAACSPSVRSARVMPPNAPAFLPGLKSIGK